MNTRKRNTKKIGLFTILAFLVGFLCCPRVYAQEVRVSGNLQNAIDNASAGDVLILTGSYSGAITVNKNLTLRGATNSSLVNLVMSIEEGATDVRLENITVTGMVQSAHTFINVKTQATLTLDKTIINYGARPSDNGFDADAIAINVADTANGSTINVLGKSMISSVYDGIRINSSNTTLNIKDSEVAGETVIELVNGKGNKVVIENSTLEGGSSLVSSAEEVLSIKSQDGLIFTATDSTLENSDVRKRNHLFSFDDEKSQNVKISLLGTTKVLDFNTTEDSDMFNFGNSPVESNNTIYVEKGVELLAGSKSEQQEATLDEKYNTTLSTAAVVAIYDKEGNATIKLYKIGSPIGQDLNPATVEGFRFKGWYEEKEWMTSFAENAPVQKNMELYPKYVKLYKVTIEDEVFTLEDGQSLSNLIGEDKEKLNQWLEVEEKNFLKFVDEEETEWPLTSPVTEDKTLTPKYTVTITIGEDTYTVDENSTLEDLSTAAKETLQSWKELEEKQFSKYVDLEGTEITEETRFTKNTTIVPKYVITVTIGEDTFTLEEGQTLKDLSEEDKEKLENKKIAPEKHQFSKFINKNTQEEVGEDTQLNENVELEVVFVEIEDVVSPSTSDNILQTFLMLVVSVAFLVATGFVLKNHLFGNKIKNNN